MTTVWESSKVEGEFVPDCNLQSSFLLREIQDFWPEFITTAFRQK